MKNIYLNILVVFLLTPIAQVQASQISLDSIKKPYLEITHLIKNKKNVKIFLAEKVLIEYSGKKIKGRITNIQKDFIEIKKGNQTLNIEIKDITRIQRLHWGIKILRILSDVTRFIIFPILFLSIFGYVVGNDLVVLIFMLLFGSSIFGFLSLPYILQTRRFSKQYWKIESKL